MKKLFFKTIGAAANQSGAMDAGDHFKNGASSKSRMSRGNFLRMMRLALFALVFIFCGCKKDNKSVGTKAGEEMCACINNNPNNEMLAAICIMQVATKYGMEQGGFKNKDDQADAQAALKKCGR